MLPTTPGQTAVEAAGAAPLIGLARRFSLAVLASLVMLVLTGCQQAEIESYRVPRVEKPLNRFLGAIIPHGDRTWFVKVMGPEQTVKDHAKAFQQFVESIHFPWKGEPPITWTAPAGCRQAPDAKEGRYATFHLGAEDHPLELTVTALGKAGLAGSVLANVNRWRGQLGLKPITANEIAKETRQVQLDGAIATVVDITGTGSGKMTQRPPFADQVPGLPEADPEPGAPTYKTPPDWHEIPPRPPRVAAFRVVADGVAAEVTVMHFPGDVGGLLNNVNRWRKEVGLPPIEADQLANDVRRLDVSGAQASYVDLVGPEGAGRRRTLAVSVPRGGQTWFFKMHGPADFVASQKTAFEAFMASVHFPADAGS
jgi:hypothetical protein